MTVQKLKSYFEGSDLSTCNSSCFDANSEDETEAAQEEVFDNVAQQVDSIIDVIINDQDTDDNTYIVNPGAAVQSPDASKDCN